MVRDHSSPRLKQAILTAGSALAAASLVVVTQAAAQPAAVTVIMPRVVRQEIGRTYSGIPVERVSLARQVSYRDLDLTTQSGVANLTSRIAATAKQACSKLDALYPPSVYPPESTYDECVQSAVDGGMVQARAAVAIAGGMATRSDPSPLMAASNVPAF
jgi:UrcA family protein